MARFARTHGPFTVAEASRGTGLGQRLKQRLAAARDHIPQIADIRGPGFMNAVEFTLPGTDSPNPDFTNRVREEALKRGLILLTCGVYGNVIRFLPPLTVPDAVFDEALGLLEDSIRAARGPGAHQAAEDGDLAPGQQES